jgi:hypothetical protein
MMPHAMRALRRVATAGAIVALMSATVSSGTAFAADRVDCPGEDTPEFVKVWAHFDDLGRYTPIVNCFANAGHVSYRIWADRFWTGNNRVEVHDGNGSQFTLEKWTDYHPSQAFALQDFVILNPKPE